MFRPLFLAVAMLNSTASSSVTGERDRILVVVPDPALATEVTARIPGVRVAVLQIHPAEPDTIINERALALRNATYFLFDESNDSPRAAMFRERLQSQGVMVINFRQLRIPAAL